MGQLKKSKSSSKPIRKKSASKSPRKGSAEPATRKRGRLKIGDEWNAIVIIASSQTSPLKAVSELVENSIDAGAKNILIQRARHGGRMYLKVLDDGEGIRLAPDGTPDFSYVATHICDSMKRKLAVADRVRVHGEFGIGILGFWSIGDEFRLVSRGEGGSLHEMVMRRGGRTFEQRRIRGKLAFKGVEVTVGGLNDTTRKLLTGEKLGRYLASDLRDRIRSLGLKIVIEDRISRKRLRVQPREFTGERLAGLKDASVPGHGPLRVELYLVFRGESSEARVAVYRDGTRVLEDLCALPDFDRPPWNTGRVEGILDFKSLNLAPGTRSGIVPDGAYASFCAAVEELEPQIQGAIEERERADEEELSKGILKSIWKAVSHALEELTGEYMLFEMGRRGRKGKDPEGFTEEPEVGRERLGPSGDGPADEEPAAALLGEEGEEEEIEPPPTLFEPPAGPLASVELKPPEMVLPFGGTRVVRARALDAQGRLLRLGVDFDFILEGDCARITAAEENRATIKAGDLEGEALLRCTAVQGMIIRQAEASVRVSEDAELGRAGGSGRREGLPSFRYYNKPDEPWRSRYDLEKNVIPINTGHRDFAAARTKPTMLRRYLGKLYAKEMVHLNFPDLSGPESMERLIELIMRMETKL